MDAYNRLRSRAIENATLLWAITETPGTPKENDLRNERQARILPISRECQLADDLAFISSYKDDSDKVMAVCIEEPTENSMIIRVATNSGDSSQVVTNLREVADLMARAASRDMSKPEMVELLFTQIVGMDAERILSRLRSKHAHKTVKAAGKPSLAVQLKQIADQSHSSTEVKGVEASRAEVRNQCKRFWTKFNLLEQAKGRKTHALSPNLLKDLVTLAHDFDIDGLIVILNGIKNLAPSTRDYLPKALRKLGRYLAVALNLTVASRDPKYPTFENINVGAVECRTVNSQVLRNGLVGFDTALSRLPTSSEPRCKGVPARPTPPKSVQKKYDDRLLHCLSKWKVHAEIQLLLFYELNPSLRRPRIICSSKSACYLCNLFFKTHGQFQIPRTHGRLYDKWTVPCWLPEQSKMIPKLKPLLEQFNRALENRIVELLTQKSANLAHPNESVIAIYAPWSSNSTLFSTKPSTTRPAYSQVRKDSIIYDCEAARGVKNLTESSVEYLSLGVIEPLLGGEPASKEKGPACTSPGDYMHERIDSDCTVVPGRNFHEKLISTDKGLVINHRDIEISMSVSDPANPECDRRNGFRVTLQISDCEPRELEDAAQIPDIDVNSLQFDSDTFVTVGAALSSNKLVVKHNNQTVAITLRFAEVV